MDSIRVAIVEDHNLTRMGLRTALEQYDMAFVGEAANGKSGLSLIEQHPPDVAIVDIGLPDMDGIELTRRIRELQEGFENPTKVLILTMHDSEEVVLAAFSAGANSYCTKEVDTEDLVTAIRETVSGHSWIDPTIANIVLRELKQPAMVADSPASQSTIEINAASDDCQQLIETYPLTDRELDILELIAAGASNAAIAEKLYITVGTVKTHVRNILNKLCVNDRTQAAVRALRSGLIK